MQWPDRVLRAFGLTRLRVAAKRSVYAGAQVSRLFHDWLVSVLSPDQEMRADLRKLRARARQLVRDNPWASGFVAELANNVVGPDGIRLQARVEKSAGVQDRAVNAAIEAAFEEWGYPETTSADGIDDWVDLQRLAIRTVATDGEFIARRIRGFDNAFGYALQVLDPDQLDETFNRDASRDENEIRMGVERDGFGRPVAYWLWNRHPSDPGARMRVPVPANEIIHLFVRLRPNQVRGVTWFAPVLTKTKMLDGYEESELVAARTAAAKMGFIVNKSADAIAAYAPPTDTTPRTMEAEPGVIDELAPGQEFQGFDPTHPSTAFDAFSKAVLRAIARGLGINYMTLTGDWSEANYSNARTGLTAERAHWRALQRWLSRKLCRPIYRDWLSQALLSGVLPLPTRLARDYQRVVWMPRGWSWIDPLNDIQAAALEVKLGLNTRSQLCAERGRDFADTVAQLADEQDIASEFDVDVSGSDTPPNPRQDVPNDSQKPARAALRIARRLA